MQFSASEQSSTPAAVDLKCPACKTLPLAVHVFNGVELDICHSCHGIWFDYQELAKMEQNDTLDNIDRAFVGSHTPRPLQENLNEDPERCCPKDTSVMDRYEWNIGSKIVIDTCPTCHGIWLDQGELEGYVQYVKTQRQQSADLPPDIRPKMEDIDCSLKRTFSSNWDIALREVVGIWLDHGELEGYVQYVKTQPQQSADLSPDICPKMEDIDCSLTANWDIALGECVDWDFGVFDDMLRGLIKLAADLLEGA